MPTLKGDLRSDAAEAFCFWIANRTWHLPDGAKVPADMLRAAQLLGVDIREGDTACDVCNRFYEKVIPRPTRSDLVVFDSAKNRWSQYLNAAAEKQVATPRPTQG